MSALPEGLVYWAVPDNSESYAQAILHALSDDNAEMARRVNYAKKFTWQRRGECLVEFLHKAIVKP